MSGQPGLIRRVLNKIGPSWHASPLRRVIQSASLIVFLWLLFYVCWPYSAHPVSSRVWTGEDPHFDATTGNIVLKIDQTSTAPITLDLGSVHVVDESIEEINNRYLGPFRITSVSSKRLELEPIERLSEEQTVLLSVSVGPWSLHEIEPGLWPSHYADDLQAKEKLPAESFLMIDPLVSISTALAAGSWVWSLTCAGVILLVCVFVPRGFCGYLCPLGTLIDLFDWAIGRRIKIFRVARRLEVDDGWWVHIKYYVLLCTLAASLMGVLLTGLVAAVPVITRGLLFIFSPLQTGTLRYWHHVPPLNIGHWVSIALFVAVLFLGFLRPRFWCKYVCPSGAVFSLGNLFRLTERKIESTCINCDRCIEICPFDAIKPDFTTRTSDCTFCQTCGGVCPTDAIKFVDRWNTGEMNVTESPREGKVFHGRRGFLATGVGLLAGLTTGVGAAVATKVFGANLDDAGEPVRPVRPPGSVPEQEFLQLCIRCGECFRACPNDVLQSLGFQQGFEGLWTPQVVADWAGCESSCNACGQVCPTGAIRALPLDEKKDARMGLAIVNEKTCLPFLPSGQREACQLCYDECKAAGYNAIEFTGVGGPINEPSDPFAQPGSDPFDPSGFGDIPPEETGPEETSIVAPVVLKHKCVGCGLCQTRCYAINVKKKGLLSESAITIEAGPGKEDRLTSGSYSQLRKNEKIDREKEQQKLLKQSGDGGYLPDK